ncbi:Spy/CpxP family protein refolding chaperone [Aliikangiella coralliicola]|uniref:Periplasmic heavy metal sensor n=1 Tax=Aliikangiella coralliicola TaxID=2592383 RepID=A0A545UH44_9GAMM|nr:Spy/CpxP family protein refolding chaperone [Aliikangiella coralliicola]TQV88780.1 periplasmic heavy metal sensor [Aliikangiella coralliicola]
MFNRLVSKNVLVKKSAVVGALFGLLMSATAQAHPEFEGDGFDGDNFRSNASKERMHRHGPGFGLRGLRHAFSHLDLSDEQKSALKSLKNSNKETIQAGREAMRSLKKEMKALLMAETIDEAAVKSLSTTIAAQKADQLILFANLKKQAIALLTDEQKAQLDEMKAKRQERMRERFGYRR